ncbi:MAG: MBOAT family protein [Actinobacteria bacterium]|nr:MBOAT family protein [Actinomycetota bacterium]MCB9389542.1 MBOAT family protein [Acidimicrobiia bacterium]
MVFPSVTFLFYFLPITVLLATVAPARMRNTILLVASFVFYAWGTGEYVALLGVSILVNYYFGARVTEASPHRRRNLYLAIAANLAMLAWFKYAPFAITQLNELLDLAGIDPVAVPKVTLPIGISFFTFQAMSYVIDISRGRTEPVDRLRDFALYVSMFPQLVAGPIVRFHEVHQQIRHREITFDAFSDGAVRFAHGLSKKVLVADSAARLANSAFSLDHGDLTFVGAWLGALAYAVQIYFDFSGYSDMAIGLGKVFGFDFPENFARPYSSRSITDFWRRWHITLSNWFRDYLYIPLGGSQGTKAQTYRNLIIVFLLTGLWHGADWTFVFWGIYHGGWMLIERAVGWRQRWPLPHWLGQVVVFVVVVFGWVLFRADSLTDAVSYMGAMVSPGALQLPHKMMLMASPKTLLMVAIGLSTLAIPRNTTFGRDVLLGNSAFSHLCRVVLLVIVFPYTALAIYAGSISPFIYFKF